MSPAPKENLLPRQELTALARVIREESLDKHLDAHPQLLQPEVVTQLSDAVVARVRVNRQEAIALANAAVAIAQRIDSREGLARSYRAKANALYAMGENKEAVQLHDRAAAIFEELENFMELGRTLSASLQPLILLGEYDRAFAAAERARDIFTRLGETKRLARLDLNVGNIFHRQDRFEEAQAHYERAYQQLLTEKDDEGIAVALSNMAMCLISLNDFPRALEMYTKARTFCEEHGMPLLKSQADYNIAYLFYHRGEYTRAIQMLQSTREDCKANGDNYHLGLCHLDLSEIYLELNLSAEAEQTAREGYVQFQKLGMGYEAAKTLANEAIALGQQGKAFRAIELFGRARTMFVKEKNLVWPWLIDLYQALLLFNEGRDFEARRLCSAAVRFFDQSILHGKAVLGHLLLARIALRSGELEAARKNCEFALERLRTLEAPVLSYFANFLMGQIHETAGNARAAYKSYLPSREYLESLRASLRADELKIAFMKNKLEVYERLVWLCLGQNTAHSAEEAFENIEHAKSRSMRELILQRGYALPSIDAGKSDLVRRIHDLREELNWYYHRIEDQQLRPEESSELRIAQLQEQARAHENELLRHLRELPSEETAGADLRTLPGVSLAEVQASLPAEATLVEYFSVGDRIVAALVTSDGLEIVPVTLVTRVSGALRLLRFQFSKFRLGADYVVTFQQALLEATRAHLRELYEELVAPLRPRFRSRHLIFVPHGVLHYLPFHALFDGERFLIDSYTISYAPSAGIYSLCQRKTLNEEGFSLILGVPDAQVPFVREEVESVASMVPAPHVFVGPEATEAILRDAGSLSRIIHIATHGHFRQDNPMFSGIRLGGSYLSLYDLFRLKLSAELVALSGCATGLNVVAAGDELLGLIRGLLYAGASCLLLSLWDVHDRSTAELMKGFYSRLRSTANKAEALKGAMLELRQRAPHPYYWAPFMLVGKVFPSETGSSWRRQDFLAPLYFLDPSVPLFMTGEIGSAGNEPRSTEAPH